MRSAVLSIVRITFIVRTLLPLFHLPVRMQEFWKQVKKLSKSSRTSATSSSVVDGCSNVTDISNIFSSKLKSLLNSDPDSQSRSCLFQHISDSIDSSSLSSVCVSHKTVCDAISQLKLGKCDGSSLSSNHFVHAKEVLCVHLSKLFTAMIHHGIVPASLRDCILVPIPKPGKDPSNSDNYCPIALAPTLSKVFEWCLLFKFQTCFVTSPLQFGFKPGSSSDLCTGLLKNVIHKYLNNDTHVFGCFLDASKAFDRVDHALLFEKLLDRNALLKMGCYSAPPPLACTRRGCYITPRAVIQYYRSVPLIRPLRKYAPPPPPLFTAKVPA